MLLHPRSISSLVVCSLPLALLVACGDDDGGSSDGSDRADAAAHVDATPSIPDAAGQPDAMPADLSCLGNPVPADATATVTLSGTVVSISPAGQDPVEGAIVELRRASNDRILDDNKPDGTPADGSYSVTARTRGTPLQAYLHSTADGLVTSRLYPPVPVFLDVPMVPLPMFDPLVVAFLSPDQEADKGIILMLVLDCAGNPIQGATVTSTPEAGDIIYSDDSGIPDQSATSTGAAGTAFLVNVPAGTVTVNATAMGESLLGHDVASVPDEVTTTVVIPGVPGV
jgi:hypothetical protein